MIEVNLLSRGSRPFAFARTHTTLSAWLRPGSGRGPDLGVLVACAACVVSVLVVGLLELRVRSLTAELQPRLERALADSASQAAVVDKSRRLQAQRDTIAQKLHVVQDLDAHRFVWPRIMAEISSAIPSHAWLTGIRQVDSGLRPRFRIEGQSGNTYALTEFVGRLEDSPSIQDVWLASSQTAFENGRALQGFAIEARYAEPPPDRVETIPYFGSDR